MRQLISMLLMAVFLLLPAVVLAGSERLAVGLNYPGVGVKYLFSDKLSLELRGQFADDIVIGGLRGSYYFNPASDTVIFMGIESDYVSFKGAESKGNGFAEELYLGLEFFLSGHFSLQVDFGPAFIILKDKDSALSVNGIEYVVNFGTNWYFGSQKRAIRTKHKKPRVEEVEEMEEEQGSDE